MSDLRLDVSADREIPLDEVVIITVAVTAEVPVRVYGQLSLLSGDLRVMVTGPDGTPRRAGWPWPADSIGRVLELEQGQTLAGGVPVIATASSQPLLAQPGRYQLDVSFRANDDDDLVAEPLMITRTPPAQPGAARSLGEREVIQSLLSASTLGSAAPALDALGAGGPRVRLLAALASGQSTEGPAGLSPVEQAATLTAVLPADVFGDDPRLRAATQSFDAGDRTAAAMLRGTPY